jgi:hypothetical protein
VILFNYNILSVIQETTFELYAMDTKQSLFFLYILLTAKYWLNFFCTTII